MRIFAFISVLIGHKLYLPIYDISVDPSVHVTIRYLAQMILPMSFAGAGGVVIFFLTSGYIITHVLQKEAAGEFVYKRIFRIYPLFIAALLIEAAINVFVKGEAFGPLSVWIPRVLLLGDFFGTPYALTSVEWTLRIEIAFYIIMAALKLFGAFKCQQYLPLVLAAASVAIYKLPYLPNAPDLAAGYMTIYLPLLFVGSCIYLAQQGYCKGNVALASSALIILLYCMQTSKLQPAWHELNYAIVSVFIFLTAAILRNYLHDGPIIRLLSGLTYSVYLFHNWIWDYIAKFVAAYGLSWVSANLQIVIILFGLCYSAQLAIEDPAIRLGRRIYKRITNRSQNTGDISNIHA